MHVCVCALYVCLNVGIWTGVRCVYGYGYLWNCMLCVYLCEHMCVEISSVVCVCVCVGESVCEVRMCCVADAYGHRYVHTQTYPSCPFLSFPLGEMTEHLSPNHGSWHFQEHGFLNLKSKNVSGPR